MNASRPPGMTVTQLRKALKGLPGDATLVVDMGDDHNLDMVLGIDEETREALLNGVPGEAIAFTTVLTRRFLE